MAEQSRQTGSILERPRGSRKFYIKFLEPAGPNGKKRQRMVRVQGGRADAARELRARLKAIDDNTYVAPSRITLAEALQRWLKNYAVPNVAAKTRERYQEIVEKHLIPALGERRLTSLTPFEIQAYYTQALERGRRRGGALSAQTVKHHHRLLSQALGQCVEWQLLTRNPCDSVKAPKVPRAQIAVLDMEQSAALIHAAEDAAKKNERKILGDLQVPVALALLTGMRRGEILALRWRDVDFERGEISVSQSIEETAAGLTFKRPKTHRSSRSIALPTLAADILKRHRATQGERKLKLGAIYRDADLICARPDGTPIRPRDFTKAFRDFAGGKFPVRFHDLRHSHLTHLLQAGVHPKVASERAGHSNVNITLNTYSHVLPGMQEDAARRVDIAMRAALDRPNSKKPGAA